MKRMILLSLSSVLCLCSVTAQNREKAFDINRRLGRGINMGNAFEAPSESAWGNPWKTEYFKIIADLGFTHVRMPIRWETQERSRTTAPYTISPDFMARIRTMVDSAHANGLMVIINMHHHEALFKNPQSQKTRFLSQWSQIALFFRDYPDTLLFEVLNEPHDKLTPQLWNSYFAEALSVIRKTNPDRAVLMGIAEYGGLGGVAHLEIPDDPMIIVSPHYYNPHQFTHQGASWSGPQATGWLGTEWKDTEAERESVINDFRFLKEFAAKQNIPVHIGEFGAYEKADMNSRARWTTFLARWFEEQGFSWAYWEFSAGFGIFNPGPGTLNTALVDALLHNPMPEAVPVTMARQYEGNFSESTDGWRLQLQGSARGNLGTANGRLKIQITHGGSEGWHAQLVKTGLSLLPETSYRFSFRAKAARERTGTVYIGKNSAPWNAYSGYENVSLAPDSRIFSYTFTMKEKDAAARMVFDLGKTEGEYELWDIVIEKITIDTR